MMGKDGVGYSYLLLMLWFLFSKFWDYLDCYLLNMKGEI